MNLFPPAMPYIHNRNSVKLLNGFMQKSFGLNHMKLYLASENHLTLKLSY